MQFCSFRCLHADNAKALHAACLAVNGVYCGLLGRVIEKGSLCPVKGQETPKGKEKRPGKR